jgi:hypothetical protein
LRCLTLCCLLAFAATAQQRPKEWNHTCNVRDYGARGVREERATQAIQAAIDACAAAGGGRVVLPPGAYTSGALLLKDNIDLHVEAGAVLFSSRADEDFPEGRRALVNSDGASRIALTGRGVIDGQSRYEYGEMRGVDSIIAEETENARKAGVDMRRYQHAGPATYLVRLRNSADVFIEDISLVNSQFWTLRLDLCERVRIRGVYIYSDLEKAVNADGIDVTSSRNVVISDSVVTTADDAICLKTEEENGAGSPTENVTVTNCVLTSSSAAFKIGSGTHADIRHVVFSNSVIRNSNRGFGIQLFDGGTVSDILVSNITMELNRRHYNWWGNAEPFYILLKRRTPASRLGVVRDVVIQNVVAHARGASKFLGDPERAIESLTIRDVDVYMDPENAKDKRAAHAFVAQRVKDLRIRSLRVHWNERETEPLWASALYLSRIGVLDLNGFTGRQGLLASGAPAVVLEDVGRARVRECAALPGSATFFEIRGQATGKLRFEANDLAEAKRGFAFAAADLRKRVTTGIQ